MNVKTDRVAIRMLMRKVFLILKRYKKLMKRLIQNGICLWIVFSVFVCVANPEEISELSGGLIVYLGCEDGKHLAALRSSDSFVVHGLDVDPARVAAIRAGIVEEGLYGPVSANRYDGEHLPFINNLVNLLVVEKPAKVTKEEMMRVLAPKGVLLMKDGDSGERKTETIS